MLPGHADLSGDFFTRLAARTLGLLPTARPDMTIPAAPQQTSPAEGLEADAAVWPTTPARPGNVEMPAGDDRTRAHANPSPLGAGESTSHTPVAPSQGDAVAESTQPRIPVSPALPQTPDAGRGARTPQTQDAPAALAERLQLAPLSEAATSTPDPVAPVQRLAAPHQPAGMLPDEPAPALARQPSAPLASPTPGRRDDGAGVPRVLSPLVDATPRATGPPSAPQEPFHTRPVRSPLPAALALEPLLPGPADPLPTAAPRQTPGEPAQALPTAAAARGQPAPWPPISPGEAQEAQEPFHTPPTQSLLAAALALEPLLPGPGGSSASGCPCTTCAHGFCRLATPERTCAPGPSRPRRRHHPGPARVPQVRTPARRCG